MTDQVEKTRQALLPVVLFNHRGQEVEDIAIRQEGGTHYCTVLFKSGKESYYLVSHEIIITPTDEDWKDIRWKRQP